MRPKVEQRCSAVGRRFGMLTVVSVSRKGNGYYIAECACDCGGHQSTDLSHLRKGKVSSCGCQKRAWIRKYPLLGDSYTTRELSDLIGASVGSINKDLRYGIDAETIFRRRNPDGFTKLKLSKSKKRGRPLKTLGGREISHEELLRGLVRHQAIAEAS